MPYGSDHDPNNGKARSAGLALHGPSVIEPAPFSRTYLALGRGGPDRRAAYRELLAEALPEDTLAEIRVYLQQQRALGTDRLREQVQAKLRRFAGVRPAHRPRKATPLK